jgi:uncharacterized protein YndB with AHSA1/START domain
VTFETNFDVPVDRQEVVITRTFAASPERVFAAHTDPNLIPLWRGPRYLTTTVDRLDAVPGGGWRYVQTADDGAVHAFHGYFHLVEPAQRIVANFEYEGTPGHVQMNDLVLEARGDHTLLMQRSVFSSVRDRDDMVAAGMKMGLEDSMTRLDELFAHALS